MLSGFKGGSPFGFTGVKPGGALGGGTFDVKPGGALGGGTFDFAGIKPGGP